MLAGMVNTSSHRNSPSCLVPPITTLCSELICSSQFFLLSLTNENPPQAETFGEKTPVSGLERGPACHPERSEGSLCSASQILRCAQDDRHDLQMSAASECALSSR